MELVQMQKGLQDYTKSLFLDVSFCYTESPLLKKKRSFCYSHFLLEIEYEGWLFKKKKRNMKVEESVLGVIQKLEFMVRI